MYQYPYTIIAGKGLGVGYSSYTQIDSPLNNKPFGQAKLRLFANVANGNLVVKDHMLNVAEMNGDLTLGFIYNSLADKPWRFAEDKRFKELPSINEPLGPRGILIEGDGHETVYTKEPNSYFYFAPHHAEGRPYFYFNAMRNQWFWYHPKTHLSEYYDRAGLLRSRVDAKGRVTEFAYDANAQLIAITGPSGERYQINRTGNIIELAVLDAKGNKQSLSNHQFDEQGRLCETCLPNNYKITYAYLGSDRKLSDIVQSDGSKLMLEYSFPDEKYPWIYEMVAPDNKQGLRIDYDRDRRATQPIVMINTHGCNIRLQLDEAQRIQKLWRSHDRRTEKDDLTQYDYNPNGQVACITHPNGGKDSFSYDNDFGLITEHLKPEGERIQHLYKPETECNRLNTKIEYVEGKTAVTRYVYAWDADKQGEQHFFLRFVIDPKGGVTEYRPDRWGNVESVRIYTAHFLDISYLKSDQVPTLAHMERWVKEQPLTQLMLTTYLYDRYGQPWRMRRFANLDAQGQGIEDAGMYEEEWVYNRFRGLLCHTLKHNAEQKALTLQGFDELQRLKYSRNALEEETHYQYTEGKVQMTLPNNRVETQWYNNWGYLTLEQQAVGNEVREKRVQRNVAGRVVVIMQPDGQKSYTVPDRQNRPAYTVSPSGKIVERLYDVQHGYHLTTHCNRLIDFTKFLPDKYSVPEISNVEARTKEVKDPEQDRIEYSFFDKSARKRYFVDAEGCIQETRYNSRDQVIAEIRYKARLSDEQLTRLKNGQSLSLTYNPQQDRCTRRFYDLVGLCSAVQDAAGYITEYQHNAAGTLIKSTLYAKQARLDLAVADYQALKPISSATDDSTYYFNDGKGQCVLEINAKGVATAHTYQANGLKIRSVQYFQPVDPAWFHDTTQAPQLKPSTSDQTTLYRYDLLERVIEVETALHKVSRTEYDKMNQIVHQSFTDGLDPKSTDASKLRTTDTRYDGWGQIVAKANPFVSRTLYEISVNNTLSPEHKKQVQETVWRTQSTREIYDNCGLKLKTIDALDNVTRYYYDIERRPVLTINPQGKVTEIIYNTFNDMLQIQQYYTWLDEKVLAKLGGGFITPELRAEVDKLKNHKLNRVINQEFDKRAQLIEHIDAEGYQTLKSYNSFGECEQEKLPVADKAPTLIVQHDYENRGLEVATTRTAASLDMTIKRHYDNAHGKLTQLIDARGGKTTYLYDSLGRLEKIVDPLEVISTTQAYDSFDRPIQQVDAMGQIVQYEYDDSKRTRATVYPQLTARTTVYLNIFAKPLAIVDGLGRRELYRYAPDDQILEHTDVLGHKTTNKYNRMGWHLAEQREQGLRNEFGYDVLGRQILHIDDVNGLKLSTAYVRDNFGDVVETTNPRRVHTKKTYDKRGLELSCTFDPDSENKPGLNLLTTRGYNGLKQVIWVQKGDVNNPDQFYQTLQYDAWGRKLGDTVDPVTPSRPNALAIATQQVLNKADDVVVHLDANGQKTHYFYDLLGQKRFCVKPTGAVQEWRYHANGLLQTTLHYEQKIALGKLSEQTNLAEVAKLIQPCNQDQQTWLFYDARQQARFSINGLGVVQETRYNLAGHKLQILNYAQALEPKELAGLTTAALEQRVKTLANPSLDRINYYVVDALGQALFTLSATGVVTQQVFDKLNRLITKTVYAIPVAEPAALAQLTPAQLVAKLQRDVLQDRTHYHVYDSAGRLQFEVEPLGAVTKYDHDENNKLYQTSRFKQPISVPSDYSALVELLQDLTPTQDNAQIDKTVYDAADRIESEIDAEQKQDHYQRDALNNIIKHTDRMLQAWFYQLDRAQRIQKEIAPAIPVTMVEWQNDKLSHQQTNLAIETHKDYDKVGNVICITKAANTQEARRMTLHYNASHQLSDTRIEDIAVDDPEQAASFSQRPERRMILTTQKVYNGKGLEVANCDEAGCWSFTVYDAASRPVYLINAEKAVTQNSYNSFGNKTQVTRYSLPLAIDLAPYTMSGIPLAVMEQQVKPSANDQTVNYVFDRASNLKRIEKPQVFYYLPGKQEEYGMAHSITRYDYNAFNERVLEEELLSPKHDRWAQTLYWRDKQGNLLAKVNPDFIVERYYRNAFAKAIKRVEFAKSLAKPPLPGMSLAALEAAIEISDEDRVSEFDYNNLGDKIAEIKVGIVVQELILDSNNIPSMHDKPKLNLTTSFSYNAHRQLISITYPDESVEYRYYNAQGHKIGETGVARESRDEADKPITIIPLSYWGVNAHGQVVMVTRFAQGTAKATVDQLPTPIASTAQDQTELSLMDNRGLAQYQQDARGNLHGYTYDPRREPARNWYLYTHWDQLSRTEYKLSTHIDEKRLRRDACNRVYYTEVLRDNNSYEITQQAYDIFGNVVAEGPGNNVWPAYQHRDVQNRSWAQNLSKGVHLIQLYDLRGLKTAELRSATENIAKVSYDQQAGLLSWPVEKLEKHSTWRDNAGRVIAQGTPAYWETDPAHPLNIPLTILFGKAYPELGKLTLSWTQPQETNVEAATMSLWPKGSPGLKTDLVIKRSAYRCGVDVSELSCDVYEYEINYYLRNPITGQLDTLPQYRTQGFTQINTFHTKRSQHLVTEVRHDHLVYFSGNTEQLKAVELWQDGKKLDEVAVKQDPQTNEWYINLANQASGEYRVIPIGTLKKNPVSMRQSLTENAKRDAVDELSLPFTIYTATPSINPLAREIQASIQMLALDNHVQVIWSVPECYQTLPIAFTCVYVADDEQEYIQEDIIRPGTDKGHYKDDKGKELICNSEFAHKLNQVKSISVALLLNEQDSLPLYQTMPTLNLQEAPTTENLIAVIPFPDRIVSYITPILGQTAQPTLQFWDTSYDRLACWKNLQAMGVTQQGVVLDVSDLPLGSYPFKLGETNGVFKLELNGYVLASHDLSEPKSKLIQPMHQFEYDSWDNVTTETDSLGHQTQQRFNVFNQVIKRVQSEVEVVAENGTLSHQSPTTRSGYNLRGMLIAEVDPRGHTQAYFVDRAGQQLTHVLADGTIKRKQIFDALGRVPRYTDARGKIWRQAFDNANNITAFISPLNNTHSFTINECNLRITDINAELQQTRYRYTPKYDVLALILPEGDVTVTEHDRNHQLVRQINNDGSQYWTRDYFGNLQGHGSLSGIYQYVYDYKYQLIKQGSRDAQHGTYLLLKQTVKDFEIRERDRKPIIIQADCYQPVSLPTPNQVIERVYRAGRLYEEHDRVHGKSTYYSLDSENRRIGVEVKQGEVQLRRVVTRLDALGRESWTLDTMMLLATGYDACGNRMHVSAFLYPGENKAPVMTQSTWNRFDANNRAIIDGGVLQNGNIVITNGQGKKLNYQWDVRVSEEEYDKDWTYKKTLIGYDDEGKLSTTLLDLPLQTTTLREYYSSGLLKRYYSKAVDLKVMDYLKVASIKEHKLVYNANQWLVDDYQEEGEDSFFGYHKNKVSSSVFKIFTASGQPQQQVSYYFTKDVDFWDYLNNEYARFDSLQLTKTWGRRERDGDSSPYNQAQLLYDANGAQNANLGVYAEDNKTQEVVLYQAASDGLVFKKQILQPNKTNNIWQETPRIKEHHYFYTVNGAPIGAYEITKDPWDGNSYRVWADLIRLAKRRASEVHMPQPKQYLHNQRHLPVLHYKAKDLLPQATGRLKLVDFIQRVSELGTGTGVTRYVVMEGDSFSGIAQQVYGDNSYASLLAEANGLRADETPTPGLALNVPPLIPMHNGAGNHIAYQVFLNTILEHLYPHLETPQPDGGFWSSFLGIVIQVVITVVIAYFMPVLVPALAQVQGAAVMTNALRAAALGALASAASQGVLIGLGAQHQFSFSNMAMGAASAGLNSGLDVQGLDKLKLGERLELAEKLSRVGKVVILEQLSKLALGLSPHFDFGEVLAAISGQMLNYELNIMNELAQPISQPLVQGMVDSVMQQHEPNIELIAAQALGTAIGIKLATPIVEQLNAYHALRHQPESNMTRREAQAQSSQVVNRKAKQPTLFNQRFSKELLKAKALAEAPILGIGTLNLEQAEAAYQDYMEVGYFRSSNYFTEPEYLPATHLDTMSNSSNLLERLQQNFVNEVADPLTSTFATIEHSARKIEQFGLVDKYSRYEDYAKRGAGRVANTIEDVSKSRAMQQRYANLAMKYGLYAKGAWTITAVSVMALPVDIALGANHVKAAEEGTKMRVAFEEYGRILGGAIGATAGGIEGLFEEAVMPVVSTPVAIAGIVVQTSAGAALGKEFGGRLYDKTQVIGEVLGHYAYDVSQAIHDEYLELNNHWHKKP